MYVGGSGDYADTANTSLSTASKNNIAENAGVAATDRAALVFTASQSFNVAADAADTIHIVGLIASHYPRRCVSYNRLSAQGIPIVC